MVVVELVKHFRLCCPSIKMASDQPAEIKVFAKTLSGQQYAVDISPEVRPVEPKFRSQTQICTFPSLNALISGVLISAKHASDLLLCCSPRLRT